VTGAGDHDTGDHARGAPSPGTADTSGAADSARFRDRSAARGGALDSARGAASETAGDKASDKARARPRAGLVPAARLHWWGTLLYVPLLYGAGWLVSRPIGLLLPQLRPDQHDLIGAVLALALLLLTLPWRLRQAWGSSTPWRSLGLAVAPAQGLRAFLGGLLSALGLLAGSCLVLLLCGLARWQGELGLGPLLNALALLFGVGFAEELLFRGWLLGELERLVGARRALGLQAALFALVHPWMRLPPDRGLALLIGLVLLGLALGLQRRGDGGLLWGAIGLHGGLVGGWFALTAGLLQISVAAPTWLAGAGSPNPNPIGGLLGWLGLGSLLWLRRSYGAAPSEPS
jgi:membrane protease YdiL (CAAX protease family)